jgi:branched-chain amino acid transport system ATP-binding protein
MSPILALEKISKRFGAIVIADGLDLALSESEALGIIGPNGAGKTTLFGIMTGTVAADAGRVLLNGADITRLPPPRRCMMGIARSFQIPQPFGGMTVFENLVVAAAFGGRSREHTQTSLRSLREHTQTSLRSLREHTQTSLRSLRERDAYARCIDLLDQCGLADKANRYAASLTLIDRKRLELARALATSPRVLLLDEVAGGLTEHECVALVDLIKAVRKQGVSIIWIEHVVHALLAVVDRLLVLHNGSFIAQGEPQAVIRSTAVTDIYMGMPVDA